MNSALLVSTFLVIFVIVFGASPDADATPPITPKIAEAVEHLIYNPEEEEEVIFGYVNSRGGMFAQIVKNKNGSIMRAVGPIKVQKDINNYYQEMVTDMKYLGYNDLQSEDAQSMVNQTMNKLSSRKK